MRTLTSGKGKVHHVPARSDIAPENPRGWTIFLCGRGSGNAQGHGASTPTCQGCQGKLRMDEFEAYYEAQRRKQRAEDAAAYERLAQRKAQEKAARKAARVTPAVHVVELKALPNYGEDNWTSDASATGEPRLVYRMHSKYGRGNVRFTIFYVGPDGEARRTHGGPVLAGPYCALVPMSSVISAHAGPREEAVEVKEGDVLILNGTPMILIDDQPYEYPHAVTPAEYGARLAAREVANLRKEKLTATGEHAWAMALQEVQTRIARLYCNGHTVLPFAFEPPALAVEHVLHLDDGDQLRLLGSETVGGERGVWAQRIQSVSGYVGETDWWPLKYLVEDGASAYAPFRAHFLEHVSGRLFEILGSETDRVTGLRGVWANPIDDDHPRWVAEDILLLNFRAHSS
jgi:hypothetical protein